MTNYEKGHYEGKLARVLKLEAILPCAVVNPDKFNGYCDGYMKRPYSPHIPKIILKNIFSAIDYY